jgi:predicted cupin superfamily sugar epimerase
MTADEVIARLGLARHPEGGWFKETFRDAASTAIYYLLAAGERSHWHRVLDASETWHFYAGTPLTLSIADPDGEGARDIALGPDLAAGQSPQAVVPAGWWQAAAPTGDWTLVGCTVAPAFDFANFRLAPPGWAPAS